MIDRYETPSERAARRTYQMMQSIKYDTPAGGSFKHWLYWRIMFSTGIAIKFPVKFDWEDTPMGDPEFHYRPWLEENVGKKGRDWEWHWAYYGMDDEDVSGVVILIPRHKKKYASMIKLMWG